MSYYSMIKQIFDLAELDERTKEQLINAYIKIISFTRAIKLSIDLKKIENNYSNCLERKISSKREREETIVIDK